MNTDEIAEINQLLKGIKNDLKRKIGSQINAPKILALGYSGCGKTTISNLLSNQKETENSNIDDIKFYLNNESNFIICDCPGFDNDDFKQEIINSYQINEIMHLCPDNNEIKILLIISVSDIDPKRGQKVLFAFERLKRMFPKVNEIKNGLGLIFSKDDEQNSAIDYLIRLKNGASKELDEWCNFFIENSNQVFVFPKNENNTWDNYKFDDYERIIEFLQDNYIINPTTNFALSETATLEVKNKRSNNSQKIDNSLRKIFDYLGEQYQNENNSQILIQWNDAFKLLLEQNLADANSIKKFVQDRFEPIPKFDSLFNPIEESESIDSFFDLLFQCENPSSHLQRILKSYIDKAINQINNLYERAQIIEKQKLEREKQELLIEQKRKEYEEQQKTIENYYKQIEENKMKNNPEPVNNGIQQSNKSKYNSKRKYNDLEGDTYYNDSFNSNHMYNDIEYRNQMELRNKNERKYSDKHLQPPEQKKNQNTDTIIYKSKGKNEQNFYYKDQNMINMEEQYKRQFDEMNKQIYQQNIQIQRQNELLQKQNVQIEQQNNKLAKQSRKLNKLEEDQSRCNIF